MKLVTYDDGHAGYVESDRVEAEIERIGVLRNPVISWEAGHPESAGVAVEHA